MNTCHSVVYTPTGEISSSHATWCEAESEFNRIRAIHVDEADAYEIWMTGDDDKLLCQGTSIDENVQPVDNCEWCGEEALLPNLICDDCAGQTLENMEEEETPYVGSYAHLSDMLDLYNESRSSGLPM